MAAISLQTGPTHPATPPWTLLLLVLVVGSPLLVARPLLRVPQAPVAAPPVAPAALMRGTVPLHVLPAGDLADPSAFQAQTLAGSIRFTPREVVLVRPVPATDAAASSPADSSLRPARHSELLAVPSTNVVRLQFVGASSEVTLRGGDRQPGVVNSFIGNDPARWRTTVPTYAGIVYENLYPGIALRYEGRHGALKGTYTVDPGADPGGIRWRYHGASAVSLDETTGDLRIALGTDRLTEHAPVVWQVKGGEQVPVAAEYLLASDGSVRFALGAYDRSMPLVIDPTLDYSTYMGGSSGDSGSAVAVDAAGNTFIIGTTSSADFPTRAAQQPACRMYGESCSVDVFVTKLDASGTLVWSTYLGGSSSDHGSAIAVDAAGNALITGSTDSGDFPTRAAQQPVCSPDPNVQYCTGDAFVTKLDASGLLAWSTYLGGSGGDDGNAIAVDAAGNAIVTGYTTSRDFPTHNAMQSACSVHYSYQGCSPEAFVTRLDASGAVVWSTYLGGSANDNSTAIAVDAAGNAFITGQTHSIDFPTHNAQQPACSAPYPEGGHCRNDAFVTKLTVSGTLAWSTYLGGAEGDYGTAIAVDTAGNAFLTGTTISTDFPTGTAQQPGCTPHPAGGCAGDAFVTKLDLNGLLVWSTYLGGNARDFGTGIVVDAAGNALITGTTSSADFPTRTALQPACTPDRTDRYGGCISDAFVTRLDASGMLVWSTYLGGSSIDEGKGIALDAAGNAVVTGTTRSADFPTHNALQPVCAATSPSACADAFVTRISGGSLAIQATVEPLSAPATSVVTATVIITNTGLVATSAVTLTLTEGDGMLHAPADDDSFGRTEAQNGINNIVHFDSGPFAPGEQKTFTIPLMLTPAPFDDPAASPVVRSQLGAVNAAGERATTQISAVATALQEVWDNAPPFDRLPGLPVADVGTQPDEPFASPTGVRHTALAPQAGTPSIAGNLWDFYLRQENFSKWSTKDKILYGMLRKANISNRDAYAIVYVKALIGMAPSKPSLPGWVELRTAAWKLWWGIEKAKKTGNQDGVKAAFKDAMGALDTVNAQYFAGLLEFHDGYTRPGVEAVQDRFRSFALDDRDIQRLLDGYFNGDISEFDFRRQMPFAGLVGHDASYWLAYRQFPRAIHVKLLSQVMVHREGGGADRNLALVIAEYLQGNAEIEYLGLLPQQLAPRWTGIAVHSPLLPLITDAQGRRAGVDARTGAVYDEIPYAVIVPGHPWQLAIPAEAGRLTVTYSTAYPFDFGIDVTGISAGTETSTQSFAGTATTTDYSATQIVDVTITPDGVRVVASPLDEQGASRVYLPVVRR